MPSVANCHDPACSDRSCVISAFGFVSSKQVSQRELHGFEFYSYHFKLSFYMSSLFTKISLANCFKKPHVLEEVVSLSRLLRSVFEDSLPEWSKGVDSSSTSASCVGSNPTAVISSCGFRFLCLPTDTMTKRFSAISHPKVWGELELIAMGHAFNLLSDTAVQHGHGAHGVVVSHPLSMREALGSIPSVSILQGWLFLVGQKTTKSVNRKFVNQHTKLSALSGLCPSLARMQNYWWL